MASTSNPQSYRRQFLRRHGWHEISERPNGYRTDIWLEHQKHGKAFLKYAFQIQQAVNKKAKAAQKGHPMTDLKARAEQSIADLRQFTALGSRTVGRTIELITDLLARVEELENGIPAERQRCIDILNAARSGAIYSDLRCIRSWIEDGSEAPKEND